jgi:hypothetical protein
MGIISIGGLLTSTFLTLLVVPVVYSLLDDAGVGLLRLMRRMPQANECAAAAGAHELELPEQ